MRNKGVTDIIAIVLLLMITISMVGFAWIWLTRMSSSAMEKTSNETEALTQTAGKRISIDNIDLTNDKVAIRNIGTSTITSATELYLYIDDEYYGVMNTGNCSASMPATLAPGQIGICTNTDISTCRRIKITAPGMGDEATC